MNKHLVYFAAYILFNLSSLLLAWHLVKSRNTEPLIDNNSAVLLLIAIIFGFWCGYSDRRYSK